MKIFIKILPTGIFLVSYFMVEIVMKSAHAPIISSVLAALYVLAHIKLVGNRVSTGISVVFAFTVALPLIVLFLIGNNTYATWQETINALYQSINEHSQLVVLEFFLPFLVSATVALFVNRYNKSLKEVDALKRAP